MEDPSTLDSLMAGQPCPRCARGRTRLMGWETSSAMFGCTIRGYGWWSRVSLPLSPKTVIYLDTSTISHMARDTSDSAPWRRLHDALAEAAADESACCVISEISRAEFELDPLRA